MADRYLIPVEAIQIVRPWGATVRKLRSWGLGCFALIDGRRTVGVSVYGTLTRSPYSGHETARERDWVVIIPDVGTVIVAAGQWSGKREQTVIGLEEQA